MVGAASVAEGYTCKATPTSPSSPHSRRTHTCYPVSRTPSKERPHSLACPHKATSTQPIRHGTYCIFFVVVLSIYDVLLWQVRVQKASLQALFCILLGFQPPSSGRSGCALYPLIDSSYGRQICAEEAENARKASVTVHVVHVVNA